MAGKLKRAISPPLLVGCFLAVSAAPPSPPPPPPPTGTLPGRGPQPTTIKTDNLTPVEPAKPIEVRTGSYKVGNFSGLQQTLAVPDDFWWDSGTQQCQAGGKKIVYRFHKVPINDPAFPGAVWAILYEVKAEYFVRGLWKADNALYSVDWFISYQGGQKANEQGQDRRPQGQPELTRTLVTGKDYTPWGTYSITVKRSGGAHGFQKTWPDPNNQTNSCDAS